jgi:hypothetical protein
MDWIHSQTNTHQDHVIAHVVGATPLGHFIWDETAYVLLDIGFVWNIYLDLEMGLLPHPVVTAELEVEDVARAELRSDIDLLLRGGDELTRMKRVHESSPIVSVELFESGDVRQLLMVCEEHSVVIETSLTTGSVRID